MAIDYSFIPPGLVHAWRDKNTPQGLELLAFCFAWHAVFFCCIATATEKFFHPSVSMHQRLGEQSLELHISRTCTRWEANQVFGNASAGLLATEQLDYVIYHFNYLCAFYFDYVRTGLGDSQISCTATSWCSLYTVVWLHCMNSPLLQVRSTISARLDPVWSKQQQRRCLRHWSRLGLEFYNLSGASRVLYHEYVIGIVGMFPVCTTSGSLLHIVVTFTIPFIWIKIWQNMPKYLT